MTLKEKQDWLRNTIGLITNGGTWAVPRSMTIYQIDKDRNVFIRLVGGGDDAVEEVLPTMGWSIEVRGGDKHEHN